MSFEHIPLNRLIASEHNVRRSDKKADIEALAASIASHGLLQNLTVTVAGDQRFAVTAGSRRHAALKLLARSGHIARDFAVPCQVIETGAASEVSLAENVQRVAMNAMDEVDAFAALSEAGLGIEDIARRFGCGARHVEQRLALARLSPKLKSAYRRGELSLDAARAFCMVDDHAAQERVFKTLGKPVTHAQNVRAHLMQGRMRASDRIARFVGLEAYEQAGGRITRDLFEESETFVDDADLLNRLASERLDAMKTDLLAKGWNWVNFNLGHARFDGGAGERIYPMRRPFTDAERIEIEEIEAQLDALDETLAESDEDDAGWDKRNDLEAQKQGIIEPTISWDPALMSLCGVVISVDHDGLPSFAYGLIAKADRAKLKKLQRERTDADAPADGADAANAATEDDDVPPWAPVSTLPKAVVRDLTRLRTIALREHLSVSPHTALALGVFAMVQRGLFHGQAAGVQIDLRCANVEDAPALEAARIALSEIIPDDEAEALAWLLDQPVATLLEILAVMVASSLDLIHEGASGQDKARQHRADVLAAKLGLDMRANWSANADFFTRLPKVRLLDLLKQALETSDLNGVEQSCELKTRAKLKRSELAAHLAQLLGPSGWLPDVLELPHSEVTVELTEAGVAAIAAQ
jgi:ParB family chromosome partitioning protein